MALKEPVMAAPEANADTVSSTISRTTRREASVASPEALLALELRVLEGPQRGARAPLVAGVGCEVVATAGQADADVVLRDDGKTVRIRVTGDMRDALIEVLEGDVKIGKQTLAAGAQAPWAMYAPLAIGRSIIVFGRAALADWPGSTPQLPAAGAAAGATPRNASNAKPAAPARRPLKRRAEVWLAGMGAVVLIICGAALGTAHLAAAPRTEPVELPPLTVLLKGSEFSTLEAVTRADGETELRGRLETSAQRQRLDTWLAGQQATPAIDVQVDEVLARDVTETFRVNGAAVTARVTGLGSVAVDVSEQDAKKLARAEEVVRRDVRGLKQLAVRNTATPLPPPGPVVPADPGKRIASLVPGEPGYVVTADGSRYFEGSMLPTGHRIVQVASSSVTLERDGFSSTLNF